MKVIVYGLWHLGSVTAACCAHKGFDTIGCDPDAATVEGLRAGKPPILEPGLDELLQRGQRQGKLRFTTDESVARDADVVWVTFDTPVDADDVAQVDVVLAAVRQLFEHLRDGCVVLISSQLPVGCTRSLASEFQALAKGRTVHFACSPENLRLGKALSSFLEAGRIVIGIDDERAKRAIKPLLASLCDTLLWVSVPSAEVTKHATNAFLAMSVTFMNEIATVCEEVGADAREVEQALRSEPRIGPRAYIRPGSAFAGGTLARDVRYLQSIANGHGLRLPLMDGLLASNDSHKRWCIRQLTRIFGSDLTGITVALLGLAYKPGTSTLRRSLAIELGLEIARAGGMVHAYDPALAVAPPDLPDAIALYGGVHSALAGADAAVVATAWPEIARLEADELVYAMKTPRLLDADGVLAAVCRADPRVAYYCVGSTE